MNSYSLSLSSSSYPPSLSDLSSPKITKFEHNFSQIFKHKMIEYKDVQVVYSPPLIRSHPFSHFSG